MIKSEDKYEEPEIKQKSETRMQFVIVHVWCIHTVCIGQTKRESQIWSNYIRRDDKHVIASDMLKLGENVQQLDTC